MMRNKCGTVDIDIAEGTSKSLITNKYSFKYNIQN